MSVRGSQNREKVGTNLDDVVSTSVTSSTVASEHLGAGLQICREDWCSHHERSACKECSGNLWLLKMLGISECERVVQQDT